MKHFVRIQKLGGMTYWIGSPPDSKNMVMLAIHRLCSSTNSIISRERRLQIHPQYLHDLCDFVGVPMDERYYKTAVRADSSCASHNDYRIDYFKTEDDAVATKDLNDLELYKRAGKTLTHCSAKFQITKAFWDYCNKV